MNCKKFQANIENYLSGKLSSKVKEGLELHLSSCNNCQKRLLSYKIVSQRIELLHTSSQNESSDVDVPYGLRENILANIRAISKQRIPLYFRYRWTCLSVLTATCLILAVSATHFDLLQKRFLSKKPKPSQSYQLNNFIADVITQTKMLSETETAVNKTSEFIGLK